MMLTMAFFSYSFQDKSCKAIDEANGNQKWLTCSANRQQHEPEKMRITQIIPSDGEYPSNIYELKFG